MLIWTRLQGRGFRRQHPTGPYILDFYRARDRLCVEIDGQDHDPAHDAWLSAHGVRVVRIPATDVLRDPDAAAEHILSL